MRFVVGVLFDNWGFRVWGSPALCMPFLFGDSESCPTCFGHVPDKVGHQKYGSKLIQHSQGLASSWEPFVPGGP